MISDLYTARWGRGLMMGLLSGIALMLATAPAAKAQNGTWTQTGAGPFDWGTAANWSLSTIADGTGFTASFIANITANQTVNLEAARTIGNITFTDSTTSSNNLTISGANILTLDVTTGAPVINVTQAGRTLTISSVIDGNDGLQKSGLGTLILNAANTYSGATTIASGGGILSLTNLNALQNSTSVSVASGTTLAFSVLAGGTYATAGTISIAGTGAALAGGAGELWFGQGGSYASTLNATINLTAAATIGSFGNVMSQTLTGAITGTGPLTIQSQGGTTTDTATWTIGSTGNASTYSGNTIFTTSGGVRDMTVKLGVLNALPIATSLNLQSSNSQNVATFTTFDLNGFDQTLAGLTDTGGTMSQALGAGKRVINSSGTLATLTLNIASGTSTYGTTGTNITAGTIGGLTAAAVAANNLAVTKTGAGTMVLQGANTYTGKTLISGGALQFGNSFSNSWNSATLSLPANSNLEINGGIARAYYYLTRTLGTGAGQIQLTGGRSGFTNLQSDATAAFVTFTTSATVVTWGSATFNPSTLVLNDVGGQAEVRMPNPFDLNGAPRTVEVSATGVGAGRGTYGTLEGNLTSGIAGGGLIKTGVGTLVLNGTNTYAGGTTIDVGGGGLWFNRLVSMPNSGTVTVSTGGILSVTVGSGGWTTGTSGNGTIGGLLAGLGGQAGGTVTYSGNVNVGFNATATSTYAGDITDVGSTLGIHVGNKDAGTASDPFTASSALTLSGNNSYTGGTTINIGTLSVGSATALGTGTGTITFNGGTIQSSDATARSFSNPVVINRSFTVGGTGNMTFSNTGASALGVSPTITVTISGVNATFAQAFSGAFTITKAGAGTLTLSGTNTHSSGTTLTAGTLVVAGTSASTSALGTGTLTWTNTGTTLQFQSNVNLSVSNTLTTAGRSLTRTLVADRATSGAAANLSFSSAPNFDCGVVMNFQAGSNIASGTPTITFSGGTGSSDSNNGTIAGGTGASGAIRFTPTGVNVVINGITSSSRTRGYILDGTSTGNQITGTWANGNGTEVQKTGTGTWTLNGVSQYTLTTTISNGTLQFGKQTALYNNNTASWTAANLIVSSGATLAFNVGGTGEFTTGNLTTTLFPNLAASSSATNGMNAGSRFGFDTTNAAGGTFTIADAIANSTGASGGARGVTKLGTNILVLSGGNTYTGPTTINAGTLRLGAADVLPNASALTIAGGTLSSGAPTGVDTGFSDSIGALTVSGTGSTIALGTGPHSLIFASLTSLTSLTITGWTGSADFTPGTSGRLFFSDTVGLTPLVLGNISFSGFPSGAALISGNELVPAPEPTTIGLIAAGGLLLSAVRRRRLSI